MKVVGITGGIGSGKTTVCRIFELLGIPVFNADAEAKKLYDEPLIRKKTIKLLGKQILDRKGKIDKKKLASIVFNDKSSLKKINGLIHPIIRQRFLTWRKKQSGTNYLIKEAAIMIESGAHKYIDYLISIESFKSLKISRIMKRDKSTDLDIDKRIREQLSDRERRKYADAIIVNDDRHSLIEQVLKIDRHLSQK